jgi:alanyl-tRNA synthetase
MTEKLYEQDSMLKSCLATVQSCEETRRGYAVVLDRTVFFPEGGGQLSDRGTLGGVKMTYAAERDGEVVHYCELPLAEGTQVEAVLDWQARLDHMQQHAGEHILSHAVWKLFGANNIGFHMGERLVTIDLDKELTAAELAQAEDYANSQIWENKPITVSYLPHTRLPELVMRKKNEKLTGTLRIVTVEGGDVCTCCGTHPASTGMIGLIRINRFDKHKDGIRVEFLCGRWALEDARQKNEAIWQAGRLLSMKPEHVPQGIGKLQGELAAQGERLKAQTVKLYEFLAPQLLEQVAVDASGIKYIAAAQEDCSAADAKLLLNKLLAGGRTVAAVVYRSGERVNYVLGCGEQTQADCRDLCRQAGELFGGKGGGSQSFAQGGGAYSSDWRQKLPRLQQILQGV